MRRMRGQREEIETLGSRRRAGERLALPDVQREGARRTRGRDPSGAVPGLDLQAVEAGQGSTEQDGREFGESVRLNGLTRRPPLPIIPRC